MCKTLNLLIANGRFGDDSGKGELTCGNASLIDYAVVSPEMFPFIDNFTVDEFDNLLSDKHNAIQLTLKSPQNSISVSPERNLVNENNTQSNISYMKIKWDPDKANLYKASFDLDVLEKLNEELENLNVDQVNQDVIDNIAKKCSEIHINPAITAGIAKHVMVPRMKQRNEKRRNNKPWFDNECENVRKEYFRAKNRYRRVKTDDMKNVYKSKGKSLRKIISKKKHLYHKHFNKRLRNLKSTNPKEYWDILNNATKKGEIISKVSIEIFLEHFKKMGDREQNEHNTENQYFNPSTMDRGANREINRPFQLEEIKMQISKLKNNKASGADYVINEYLKNSPHDVKTFMVKMFNIILETGIVPLSWSVGIIKPIYKKRGSPDDPNNYRGITLLSCLSKLFTAVINERLSTYLETEGLLGEEQAAFRRGYSTIDHVFVLHSILTLYLKDKKRVYCAFVDYRKAFDLINRVSLWSKLISCNVNGKLLTVIQTMYKNAKSCVQCNLEKSDFFDCQVGVRQGENLSPLLFSIYLNDFEAYLSRKYEGLKHLANIARNNINNNDDVNIEVYLKLFVLLYADDTIIMAENEIEMQRALNAAHEYCERWDLEVNTDKTKIVIFSKGKVRRYPNFTFGDSNIEVIADYPYLGVTFNYNNKFHKAKTKQVTQAKRAMFNLLSKAKKLYLPIDLQLELFDQLVMPILTYGCKVWGFEDLTQIETLFLKFCKLITKVKSNTAKCMMYGELGRYKLKNVIENRMINYWYNIVCSKENKLSHMIYKVLKILHDLDIYKAPWICRIKKILDDTGMSFLWLTDNNVNKSWLKNSVKQRINDISVQEWNSEVQENSHCINYKIFKKSFKFEEYLTKLNQSEQISLCKFRCRDNRLPVVTGRYRGIDYAERFCELCNDHDIGDEFHYLFKCPIFASERKQYLKPYFRIRPNTIKLEQLFNTKNVKQLSNLAKLCKLIMNKM